MAQPATKVTTIPISNWEKLRQIIAERSFSQGDSYVLASGKTSRFYFDMKQTMLDPEGLSLLSDLILEKIADLPAKYVGGLAMGAVPVAVAVLMKSGNTDKPLQGFWVRKEAKGHGTRKLVDGYLPKGSDVVIVDDVTTSGGSVLLAIEEVLKHDCKVNAVITIVDREEGAKEKLASHGVDLINLFTISNFTSS